MLQIDHIYEFFCKTLFRDFTVYTLPGNVYDVELSRCHIFNADKNSKIFFVDQEPILESMLQHYLDIYLDHDARNMSALQKQEFTREFGGCPKSCLALITSEISKDVDTLVNKYQLDNLYYFYHGFAALDWYRGYYALNYAETMKKSYKYDYVSFNRIINNDRSYRIYWVSKLAELDLLSQGQVSFNVTDNLFDDWRDEVADPNTKLSEHARQHAERHLTTIDKLMIDSPQLPGSASADIPREVDALWHIVTETVFYYDKLHLTEKIFKPIVSKQPFMLIAAPGNLEYLRSYGFKTFDGIINENYDNILDDDARINAVAKELDWYCNLHPTEKSEIIEEIEPIVEYNFNHFYGEFRHIIAQELINNTKKFNKDLPIDYESVYHVLVQ